MCHDACADVGGVVCFATLRCRLPDLRAPRISPVSTSQLPRSTGPPGVQTIVDYTHTTYVLFYLGLHGLQECKLSFYPLSSLLSCQLD